MKSQLHRFEDESKILKSIAGRFRDDSVEHATLRRAALALFYVATQRSLEFEAFIRECDRNLTPEEKAHLRFMGLTPD